MAAMAARPVAVCGPPSAVLRPQRRIAARTARAASADSAASAAPAAAETLQLTLRKPLGLVLAERPLPGGGAQVFVEEVVAGGNADLDGRVRVGDVLASCSAVLLKSGRDGGMKQGHGERLYDNWERTTFDCRGAKFDTVMSALASNNERWGIFDATLVFERPAAGEGGSS